MAITDYLYIRHSQTPEELLRLFFDCAGIQVPVEMNEDQFALGTYPDAYSAAAWVPSERSSERAATFIGFRPNVRMSFDFWKFTREPRESINILKTRELILSTTLEFMQRMDGDLAVVHVELLPTSIALRRLGGQLQLNKRSGYWTKEHLRLITLDYEMIDKI